jgi:hypothetical protein
MPSQGPRRTRNETLASLDLSPTQREILDLSSPYHDNFTPTVLFGDIPVPPPPQSYKLGAILSFFKRFRYSKLDRDAEKSELASEVDDDDSSIEHLPRRRTRRNQGHWQHFEEKPTHQGFTLLFLLLTLSVLVNLFLLFHGLPNDILRKPNTKADVIPHKGFHFGESGNNYTCYEAKNTSFQANLEFSSTNEAYDHLWRELQGKSEGFVYTKLGRSDGKVRRARLAMFHQLSCLSKLRSGIQAHENNHDNHEFDVGSHREDWLQCFDYLRQVFECNADDSVEVSDIVQGRWVTNGFGSPKECRNKSWLYDVTSCGEGGCPRKPFHWGEREMAEILNEENEEIRKWTKEHRSNM